MSRPRPPITQRVTTALWHCVGIAAVLAWLSLDHFFGRTL
jgi:hypothetical protein